jgi:hypothetical protein
VGRESICLPLCPTKQGEHCPAKTVCERDAVAGASVCRPHCEEDADCGSGVCDRATGLCRAASAATAGTKKGALGVACKGPSDPSCEGACLEIKPGRYACSSKCAQGSRGTCPVCLGDSDTFAIGAPGLCRQPCAADSDCSYAGATCKRLETKKHLAAVISAAGYCDAN